MRRKERGKSYVWSHYRSSRSAHQSHPFTGDCVYRDEPHSCDDSRGRLLRSLIVVDQSEAGVIIICYKSKTTCTGMFSDSLHADARNYVGNEQLRQHAWLIPRQKTYVRDTCVSLANRMNVNPVILIKFTTITPR